MRIATAVILLTIILGFATAAYYYPQMPDRMASHWGLVGEANGYMDKSVALFLMPVISVLLLLLFIVIPRIDPMKHNIKKFWGYYEGFIVLIMIFLLYLHALVISWNIGVGFSMPQMLAPAFGILFYYIGILTGNAKRNYSIGIRTPWTLSNEATWNRTHKTGGKLFKLAGIIALTGAIFVEYAFYLVLVPVIADGIGVYIYSYFVYKEETRKRKK